MGGLIVSIGALVPEEKNIKENGSVGPKQGIVGKRNVCSERGAR